MPLSWNEIKDRALKFSREWADEASEDAEAKSFWDGFFDVFGIPRRRVGTFERKVKKVDGKDGFIDLLWKGVLLVEHKSRGKDLDRAHVQARGYFHGLTDVELPKYLLVSDFARFRLYDLETGEAPVEFALKDLHKHVRRFGFIAGYQARAFKEQDPVNVHAAERMGKLHDALKAAGFDGHALEVLLVRLLFCLFADDTGIFPRHAFHELVAQRTSPDGADLGPWLAQLFQTLNTDPSKRQKTLDEQLAEFPYVNGKLFDEGLPLAAFDKNMRDLLLDASALDWSRISPAIFGSMFQSVMDAKARRNLGAHYTSETNILKLIGPLFLDDLKAELDRIGTHEAKLKVFHNKLAKLKFLDPACGCGNFLVIAYRELRLVELEVLARLYARQGSVLTNVADHLACDVDQFYGIEVEEFPAQIAQVALWLMDHQMNLRLAEQFGEYFARLPLKKSPTISNRNAMEIDWNDVVAASNVNFLLGNPPFVGKKKRSKQQTKDLLTACAGIKGAGVLDYVAAWFMRAAVYMKDQPIKCAFVATNSITQGEQVGILWGALLQRGITISFAHRTFQWRNEAPHVAAVHVVIIGFDYMPRTTKSLFDYHDVRAEPVMLEVSNINPYLVAAADILLKKRSQPLQAGVPAIRFGSMANDGGNLLLTEQERSTLVARNPKASKWIRPFMQVDELLYSSKRYCLWLDGISPAELLDMPDIMKRVQSVRIYREESTRATTRELAKSPTLFGEVRQPKTSYWMVPRHTGEDRKVIPIALFTPDVICGDANLLIADSTLLSFGVFESRMHMAWVGAVCGRIKSDYRYSARIVYNNFPWPENISDTQRTRIEDAAQAVLEARAMFEDSTLAQLYGPAMPPALVKSHYELDRAVDAAYGKRTFKSDADRVAFLFERYQAMTSLLPAAKVKKTPRAKKTGA
jgi:hypothetical protein